MKHILLLLLVALPLFASAQTMKFMGIPMGISVDKFTDQLDEKGMSPSQVLKARKGERSYEGTYQGQPAWVVVKYDKETNWVKDVVVGIFSDSKEALVELKSKMEESVQSEFTYTRTSFDDPEKYSQKKSSIWVFASQEDKEHYVYAGGIFFRVGKGIASRGKYLLSIGYYDKSLE